MKRSHDNKDNLNAKLKNAFSYILELLMLFIQLLAVFLGAAFLKIILRVGNIVYEKIEKTLNNKEEKQHGIHNNKSCTSRRTVE